MVREVVDLVSRYLDDSIGLRELYEWIVEHADWLVDAPTDDGSDLARLIESHLAEMSVFRSDEDALRKDLEMFLTQRSLS